MSPEDSQATDITLDMRDLIRPGVAKITLIVPKGGLEGTFL